MHEATAQRRIVIYGSECTGKTTLARGLAERFGGVWLPEVAREWMARKGAELGYEDMEPIARAQVEAEDRAAEQYRAGAEGHANSAGVKLVFCDMNPLSTGVYSRHYYGRVPQYIEDVVRGRRYDLYLLTDIDIPWVADGQRDRPDVREAMHALFETALRERGEQFELVRGLGEMRLERASMEISKVIEVN